MLEEFSAPYFHFREWSAASAVVRNKRQPDSTFTKNPFKTWSQSRLDEFLFKLADVAASGDRVIVGGYVPAKKLCDDKTRGFVTIQEGPRELCVSHFFNSIATTVDRHKPPWKSLKISFVFEQQRTNKEWGAILRSGFDATRQKNRKFRDMVIGCKEDHLPLQAADMVAYRLRQRLEKTVNLDFSDTTWPKLDNILFKAIDEWSSRLSEAEEEAVLRRFFVIPQNVTYEQAIQSIRAKRNSI